MKSERERIAKELLHKYYTEQVHLHDDEKYIRSCIGSDRYDFELNQCRTYADYILSEISKAEKRGYDKAVNEIFNYYYFKQEYKCTCGGIVSVKYVSIHDKETPYKEIIKENSEVE